MRSESCIRAGVSPRRGHDGSPRCAFRYPVRMSRAQDLALKAKRIQSVLDELYPEPAVPLDPSRAREGLRSRER